MKTRHIVIIIALAFIAIASASLSAYTYLSTPQRIKSYVQSHKKELKGDKGDMGPAGPEGAQGEPGQNGATYTAPSSLSCTGSSIGDYTYTNCY